MARRGARVRTLLVALALVAAACGNSGSDESDPAGADDGGAPSDLPADMGASERDTHEAVDAPGVSDTEIRYQSIATITGNPLGTDIGNAYDEGIEAYFAWRNSEGGIYGRDLVLDKVDDQLGANAARAQELVSSDSAFGAFVATLLFTGAPVLDDAGVPTYGWGIHAEFSGKRNLFGHNAPLCAECTLPMWPYMAAQEGATNIGVLAYNTSDASKKCGEGLRASFEQYGADAGDQQVVFYDDNLSFGLPGGLGPQVSDMKAKGVQFITSCLDMNGMKTLADELDKQGMDDVVMLHPNSYDADFVAANADLLEGDYVLTTFTPFETPVDSDLQQTFFEWTAQRGITVHELTMVGWINADLAFTSLLAAGPQFDREAVVDAARSITNYNADNLVESIDWSRQLEDPGTDPGSDPRQCGAAVQVRDGAFVPFSGEEGKPWLCWETGQEEYSEPDVVGDFG
jgi:ABC-type branched-subunit amino acid transport system substrate-binding protein